MRFPTHIRILLKLHAVIHDPPPKQMTSHGWKGMQKERSQLVQAARKENLIKLKIFLKSGKRRKKSEEKKNQKNLKEKNLKEKNLEKILI